MPNKKFQESTAFTGRVDEANNRVLKVALITSESRNGRVYKQKALNSIKDKADGVKSFLDHSTGMNNSSVKDLLGVFSNPRLEGNTVYADLEVLKSSVGKALLMEVATKHPKLAGFSISGTGEMNDKPDAQGREVVEDVVDLRSVDFVGSPASTNGVFEHEENKSTNENEEEQKQEFYHDLQRGYR